MKKLDVDGIAVLVDDEDLEYLLGFRWHCKHFHDNKGRPYFFRKARRDGPGASVQMHRELMGLQVGDSRVVDHINGNPLDNRRCNLRIGTRQENIWNSRVRRDSRSGLKGVTYLARLRKYQASIGKDGIRKYLGVFLTAGEAAVAYNKAAKELHGNFACLNETITEKDI